MSNTSNLFTQIVAEVREGDCLDEASRKLQELVAAVIATGKSGKLKLTLSLKAAKVKSQNGTVLIEDELQISMPKPDKDSSLFFATSDHLLQRKDPSQQELQFKTVEGGQVDATSLKSVNG